MAEITQKAAERHPSIINPHTPHWETSEVGRKASRPGGKPRHQQDEVNLERSLRRVPGQEITLKRDVSVSSRFPLPGPHLTSPRRGRAAGVCKPQGEGRVGNQAGEGRGHWGQDECAGSRALWWLSCCLGHHLRQSYRIEK